MIPEHAESGIILKVSLFDDFVTIFILHFEQDLRGVVKPVSIFVVHGEVLAVECADLIVPLFKDIYLLQPHLVLRSEPALLALVRLRVNECLSVVAPKILRE